MAVGQELWGVLIAYNLVRLEMERVADQAGVAPTRISFVGALRLITDEWQLRADLKRLILPPRRSEGSYPRAVKVKMSNYPRRRRSGCFA